MTQIGHFLFAAAHPFHVCHVCATQYRLAHPQWRRAQPAGCPVCDAPRRFPIASIGGSAYSLLLRLGGAPVREHDETWYDTLPELSILDLVRTYSDVDAIFDEIRAACSELYDRADDKPLRDDPEYLVWHGAHRAARERLVAQLESGVLEWRLDELQDRVRALLRAEHEHHQQVATARRGR